MINREKLKPEIIAALSGSAESRAVVREVLRPKKTDTVEDIYEKISIFIKLIFTGSLKFKDSPSHKEIDFTYAEQIHSLLTTNRPKYKGMIFVGYRESAKTTRVKFNQAYMNLYLEDMIDYTNVVSEDGSSSDQFNMDMFNSFAFSKIALFFPETISSETRAKKKESQTMSKFTTSTGVTYSASGSRKSKRGNVKVDINEEGEIETKRPKQVIFDDIENETTVKSIPVTAHIGSVMNATIDGMDQISGFWVLLGNYLSLRGNVARFINKYKDDPQVKTIMIPIHDLNGEPTWPGKYVKTDKEELELAEKGIIRRSIESIRRDSDNFDTEFLNNPKRNKVYFDDKIVSYINEETLINEFSRDDDGLLILEEPESTSIYIMANDTAKGNGGDQSSFTVYKTNGLRYEEVANFISDKIKPEDFATYSANIASRYNNALIIPENNYPGNEFIAFLRRIYNNIYKVEKGTKEDGTPEYEFGIHTNLKTKPEMFLKTKEILRDKLLLVRSRALYDQLLEYPSDDVLIMKQKDGSGGHFDLLMSAVIGLWKAGSIASKSSEEVVTDGAIKKVVDNIFEENSNNR